MIKALTRKGALLDLMLTNKAELVVDVKVGGRLGCTDHEMMQFRILSGRSRAKKQDHNPELEEGRLQPVQRFAWKNPVGYSPGEKRDVEELVGMQRSPPPPSSRNVYPNK